MLLEGKPVYTNSAIHRLEMRLPTITWEARDCQPGVWLHSFCGFDNFIKHISWPVPSILHTSPNISDKKPQFGHDIVFKRTAKLRWGRWMHLSTSAPTMVSSPRPSPTITLPFPSNGSFWSSKHDIIFTPILTKFFRP